MRPCLVLLGALCLCTVGGTRNGNSNDAPSALRRALWWNPVLTERQTRAGPSSTPAKGASDSAKKVAFNSGAPESPGVIPSHENVASKAQQSLRSPRGARQYDVPQIECPSAEDGMERFACPSPDRMGRYRCIDDHVLCDGFIDCPQGEDEDRMSCMFYKTVRDA